ncbi:retrovirus-related pol polyprotein from transposon TNT 1-94, partial [Tanacetum coccineum]
MRSGNTTWGVLHNNNVDALRRPSKVSFCQHLVGEFIDKLPVIIAKDLSVEEKAALIKVLKSHKRAIAWKLSDIKGINPEFCTHKILMEEDYKPAVQHQRRVNPKIHDVIKKEVEKLLDAGLIYPISDSPWVSPVHCVPKKGGFTVVENDENELIPTRLVTGWRVCIDYRKLNEATRKDHFPLPFMDQMLERLAGNEYYCFLDGFSGYFQIPIDPHDQEKTTFTCPYGTFAYRRMPFGLCNAPGTFQRYKMLQRCEDTNLCLNWEKSHFMVKEGIVLGHKISKNGIEVDKAKVDVIAKLPHPTTVKGVQSFLGHASFYRRKEAIHLILTGIGDEIYLTVDASQTAQQIWEAIERLQQGESLNIQDVKTNLFWEFGQFTSHVGETIESYYTRFYKMMNEMIRNNLTVATMQVNVQFLQQLQPEWSRFVTIVKQQHKLDEVSYHKLFDILKQYQKEVNELRAERMAKNANPLALVATAQTLQDPYYQTSKPHKSYAPTSKASLPTRSHATTRYKGKEIAKPITPPSESASEEDSDPEQAQKDKDMQKNLALIAKYFKKLYKPTNNNLRTSSNTRNKNVDTTPRYKNDNQTGQFGNQRAVNVVGARETVGGPVVQQSGIQCFNCKEFGHYAKECRKPKRVKDSTYHKEKMLLCKQAEKGVQLQAEQSDWLADTDEEIDEQELEAHYSYMAKIQEVPNADSGTDAEPLEQ